MALPGFAKNRKKKRISCGEHRAIGLFPLPHSYMHAPVRDHWAVGSYLLKSAETTTSTSNTGQGREQGVTSAKAQQHRRRACEHKEMLLVGQVEVGKGNKFVFIS